MVQMNGKIAVMLVFLNLRILLIKVTVLIIVYKRECNWRGGSSHIPSMSTFEPDKKYSFMITIKYNKRFQRLKNF